MSSPTVGSVAVEVVPAAEDFWTKFKAKTKGGADRAGRDIGKSLGKSIGDAAGPEARTRINVALKDLKANVNLDTSKAQAEALALRKTLNGVGDSNGIKKQTKDMKLLSTALVAGVAAAVPVAGAAAGALLGLGAAGATALVGVLGIRDAMKQGTPIGQAYQKSFAPITAEFTHLKQLSAAGMFSGINAGAKASQKLFPQLNRDVAIYSTQIGQIAGHVGPGLVAMFGQLSPLFRQIGDSLVGGAAKFEAWAKSSEGIRGFVAYAQNALPSVERTLGSLITTVSHLAQGFAPFGSTTLTTIRLFSTAINLIPIGVLQTLLPLLAGLKIGSTLSASLNNASVGLTGFATKAREAGGFASKSAGLVGGLGKAVGFLGPVGVVAGLALGGLSVVLGRHSQASVEDTKRVNELTKAIQDNNLVLHLGAQFQASGAVDAARKYGLSQADLVGSITEQGAAASKVRVQLADLRSEQTRLQSQKLSGNLNPNDYKAVSAALSQVNSDIKRLSGGLSQASANYATAKANVQGYARELGDAALVAAIGNGAYLRTAGALGTTGDAYLNAKLAADQQANSTKAATLAMQIEGDTAGLLKTALDGLAGKSLSIGEAETHYAQSVTAATDALKQNGNTVALNTAKGQANRSAIEQVAEANRSLVDTQLKGVPFVGPGERDHRRGQREVPHERGDHLRREVGRIPVRGAGWGDPARRLYRSEVQLCGRDREHQHL